MTLLFKRLSLFSLLGFVYFLTNLLINYYIINYAKPPIADSNILIMGDSHLQTALDPECFASAQNICQGAEPIVVSYWKIKYLMYRIKFDTLILGFSYQNISSYTEQRFSNDIISTELYKRIYAIERFDDLKRLNINYYKNFIIFFKNMCLFPKPNHTSFIGSYKGIESLYTNDTKTKIEEHFYKNKNEPYHLSYNSMNYLDSIVRLCEKNNKTVILVGAPLHKDYFNSIPNIFIVKYNALFLKYTKSNILFLNFNQFFDDDKLFYNADHLNLTGSQKFTNYFMGVLKTSKI
ncbi:MAG TPA: hypothetical protein DCG75_17550 [Bacteroidales bacterium]|nr:hypothetical protein [Bacteroidales bacterium]